MQNNKDDSNKRILIATVLSALLMVLWIKFYGKRITPSATVEQTSNSVQLQATIQKEAGSADIQANNVVNEDKKDELANQNPEVIVEKLLPIETDKIKGRINLRGLVFDGLTLLKYTKEINSTDKVTLLSPQNSNEKYFINLGWISDDKTIDLPNQNTIWEANRDQLTTNNPVVLSYKNKDGIVFEVIISIDNDYMFNINQKVINNTDKTIVLNVNNQIVKKNAPVSKSTTSVFEGFIGSFNNRIEEEKYKKLEKKDFSFNTNFKWAGFTDKYWLVSIATNKTNFFDVKTTYNDKNFTINFKSNSLSISPSQSEEISSPMFTGPKILSLLDQYASQYDLTLFDRAVDFGWFYFLTKPIYMILKTFYSFFGNFGIAILFLTFVVKSIMYPFTKKSYISMAKMKKVQPKIDALKERFKDDKMKMNRELIELYKKENISPLSGCLPMLVQIPVFFSLYKVLAISIDMRQAPFFGYIKNLADKDPTTIWNLFGLLPYDISFLPIGLLPCLMALTMWIQQKMTSGSSKSSPETQTATKLMPFLFLFMFSGMPAGLLIYWTFSNIITIGQQVYVEKRCIK